MKEIVGDDRCGGSMTGIGQASNLEECGFHCKVFSAKRKMIHFGIRKYGPYCGCLEECSHKHYITTEKQYAFITGMVILFT